MHRTQIYLDDEIYEFLESEKKKTRLSYSEIIRLNLKKNIQDQSRAMIARMEKAAGAWNESSNETPAEYMARIRSDRKL